MKIEYFEVRFGNSMSAQTTWQKENSVSMFVWSNYFALFTCYSVSIDAGSAKCIGHKDPCITKFKGKNKIRKAWAVSFFIWGCRCRLCKINQFTQLKWNVSGSWTYMEYWMASMAVSAGRKSLTATSLVRSENCWN